MVALQILFYSTIHPAQLVIHYIAKPLPVLLFLLYGAPTQTRVGTHRFGQRLACMSSPLLPLPIVPMLQFEPYCFVIRNLMMVSYSLTDYV